LLKNVDTKLKLEFTGPKEVIFVEADKGRIIEVILNFLCNAVKFTNEDTVTAATGIDSEILSRLFTKVATKSTTGTGLGLFISKSIIDVHGGKIWGKNKYSDGKAATFGFSLPMKSQNLKYCVVGCDPNYCNQSMFRS